MSAMNKIRAETAAQLQQVARTDIGIVVDVDPNGPSALIHTVPEDTPLGWIPLPAAHVGPNATHIHLPAVGTQCVLHPVLGDSDSYVISHFLHSDLFPVPQAPAQIGGSPTTLAAGDYCLLNEAGALIRVNADGTILFLSPSKVMVQAPEIALQGDLNLNGSATATGSASTGGNLSAGTGATGSFTTPTGQIVTVQDGLVTNIY